MVRILRGGSSTVEYLTPDQVVMGAIPFHLTNYFMHTEIVFSGRHYFCFIVVCTQDVKVGVLFFQYP